MKSTTIKCIPCKGVGSTLITEPWSEENNCKVCDGYGYRHAPKGWFKRRTLLPGENFFFLSAWEDDPKEDWNPRDYVELNGGGCLYVGDAEASDPDFDRKKNFFFTREEARKALSQIRTVVRKAK